jgi:DNA primase
VRGEKVPFILGAKDKESQKVAFVESPIDALSLRDLGFGGRIVATVGNAAELARAKADIYRQQGLTVVAAFDNDRAGDAMARSLGQCERLKPSGKDWNEDLRAQRLTPAEHQALELERQQARARSRGPSFGI